MRSFDTIFEYNQHFVAMMNIINNARLNKHIEGHIEGHRHHIIPKCWFKKYNLDIDNSDNNIVLLTEEEHCKVHKLMALCIIGNDMRSAMGFAVHRLHGSFRGMHHTEDTRKKLSTIHKGKKPKNLDYLHKSKIGTHLSEEVKHKISEGRKGKHTGGECFKGMKWKLVNGKRVWYNG